MKTHRFLSAVGAMALLTSPVFAQDTTQTSNSNAGAQSGSISGAASDANHQGQTQSQTGGNNAGIGSSTSTSGSNAVASSATRSDAASIGNTQGQSATLTTGQTASNSQGVAVSNTFNSTQLKRTYVGTNTAVPLAASSSFSSDYCGGTASGGVSTAPIGLSIGGSGPVFDNSCRYLRLAEKAGMLGANYYNAGYKDMAGRAFTLEAWATCMAGPMNEKRKRGDRDNHVMEACMALGLLGSDASAGSPPAMPAPTVSPMETQKPNITPDDTGQHDAPVQGANDYAGHAAKGAATAAAAAIRAGG